MTTEHVAKRQILIDEHNPSGLDVLIDQLVDAGLTIAVAEDGERALEHSQHKPLVRYIVPQRTT